MPPTERRRLPHLTRAGSFGVSFGSSGVESWASTRAWLLNGDDVGGDNVTVDNAYERSGVIATAIELIAMDGASVPWELYPKGTGPRAAKPVDHPIAQVWSSPNPNMLGSQLWVGSYLSFQIFGEAFWYYPDLMLPELAQGTARWERTLAREGNLYLLDPRMVKAKDDNGVIVWSLRRGGRDEPLDPERLTVFKSFNPNNPARGLSRITQVLVEAFGDRAAAAWNARFFNDQNGIPSGLLVPGGGIALSPEQRDRVLQAWNQTHGRRRSVGLLPSGWDWKDLKVTQRDMDFPGLRGIAQERMLARLGVPPFMAGVLDKADYANAKKQTTNYWRGTIGRFLRSVQETLNFDFLPKVGVPLEAWPKWEAVRANLEDLDELTVIAERLWKMGIPLEQVNERLDLGFDTTTIPMADTGWVPIGLIPAELAGEAHSSGRDGDGDGQIGESADEDKPPAPDKFLLPTQTDEERARTRARLLWRQLSTLKLDVELRFNKNVRRLFSELRAESLANLEGFKGWMLRTAESRHDEETKADQHYLFDGDKAKARLRKVSGPVYREAAKRGGESIVYDIGLAVSFDMNDPAVLNMLATLETKIVGIVDTVAAQLRESLTAGLTARENMMALRDRVQGVFGSSLGRSLTIARTEVGKAFTGARYQSMKAHAIKQHRWVNSKDADVREHHKTEAEGGVAGQIVDIGTPFKNGLLYPLDSDGPPEQVINCRCVAVAVVSSKR